MSTGVVSESGKVSQASATRCDYTTHEAVPLKLRVTRV